MTDSVISKEQLEMLLASNRGAVQLSQLESAIESAKIQMDEKNALYFRILDTIRSNSNDIDRAKSIFALFDEILESRLSMILGSISESRDEDPVVGRQLSPIFNRVG